MEIDIEGNTRVSYDTCLLGQRDKCLVLIVNFNDRTDRFINFRSIIIMDRFYFDNFLLNFSAYNGI